MNIERDTSVYMKIKFIEQADIYQYRNLLCNRNENLFGDLEVVLHNSYLSESQIRTVASQ